MELPQGFARRMEELMGPEAEALLAQYQGEGERWQALRVNPLKISPAEFARRAPFALEPVPWAPEGFYYSQEDRPGLHPWHEAGVYYIQEPSAMAAGRLAEARPGERILDLCAAPGGKSACLAGQMQGRGLLVCNEIHPKRAQILSQNMERMGAVNALVLNETPERLARRLPGFFDKILVDAPCSGEGMFRKSLAARQDWSLDNIRLCARRQDEILDQAVQMLRPGGLLIYSTCTFAPEEDEGTVERLAARCGFALEEARYCPLFEPGRPQWSEGKDPALAKTARLWPHKLRGEGHFMALLRKPGQRERAEQGRPALVPPPREWLAFAAENLPGLETGEGVLQFGDRLYRAPEGCPPLEGLRALRPGLELGTLKKNRLEPSHALALALSDKIPVQAIELEAEDPQARAYLRGEQIAAQPGQKGWALVKAGGFALGWCKISGAAANNHLPKGLRRRDGPTAKQRGLGGESP